ncbi:hypothetical protein SPHINGO391_420041 [Sphingomonas aurantiaca]|uniref:Uncharacterized protein n=1 Tax=Sphingomonas aurantiaca TaxID=185949 RepID=A0A5E7Z0B5_9SPHN|nr:hypothetical protein SPHINGO391_420041 [Sphingomonas aurantiaca]
MERNDDDRQATDAGRAQERRRRQGEGRRQRRAGQGAGRRERRRRLSEPPRGQVTLFFVIPAQAGIHIGRPASVSQPLEHMGPRLRGDDEGGAGYPVT